MRWESHGRNQLIASHPMGFHGRRSYSIFSVLLHLLLLWVVLLIFAFFVLLTQVLLLSSTTKCEFIRAQNLFFFVESFKIMLLRI